MKFLLKILVENLLNFYGKSGIFPAGIFIKIPGGIFKKIVQRRRICYLDLKLNWGWHGKKDRQHLRILVITIFFSVDLADFTAIFAHAQMTFAQDLFNRCQYSYYSYQYSFIIIWVNMCTLTSLILKQYKNSINWNILKVAIPCI